MTSNYFTESELFAQCTEQEKRECLSCYFTNMKATIELADKVRGAYGKPLHVNSFYRNAEHNQRVGGVPTSQHLLAQAIDLQPLNAENPRKAAEDLYNACIGLENAGVKFGQVILYDKFVHVSIPYHNSARGIENEFFSKRK